MRAERAPERAIRAAARADVPAGRRESATGALWRFFETARAPVADVKDSMRDVELQGGGHARGSGSFYHVSFRSGSRGGGACARSAHDYITREGEYAGPDRDAALYTESGHMPAWAADDPRAYWDAADVNERANGRLYVSGDFALPRDLSAADQVELARHFVEELTAEEHLPYTWAIHAGHDRDGQEHNPHVHVLISERQHDGLDRGPREWFRRIPNGAAR